MNKIKKLTEILYSKDKYNFNFVSKSKICKDCETIPKVHNAGEIIKIGENECIVMHNGVLIYQGSYHTEWMTDVIKNLKGHHEPQDEKLFYEVLKYIEPGSIMVECGSSWAYYSLWFNKQIFDAKNYLIEPNPYKLEFGKLNFDLNKSEGVFIDGYISNSFSENSKFTDWDGNEYETKKISVDSLFEEYNIERINILHADIQNNEHSLLMGSINSLKNQLIDFIFLSTHSNNKNFSIFLEELGYKIISNFEINESFGDDGLILSCSPTIYKKLNLDNFTITKKI